MRIRNLLAIVMVGALCGCSTFSPKAFDQVTIDQIDATIEHEKANTEILFAALDDCGDAQAILELQIRRDAELARLEAWKNAESKKAKVED